MQNHKWGAKFFLFSIVFMTFSFSANAVNNSDSQDISIINTNGGRVDWSPSGNNLIAFDRMGSDGYFDVWTMKLDGSEQRCLTCGPTRLPQKHIGNPVWHPSGKFIVFQAQKRDVPKKFDPKCAPGAGTLNDLWVMTSNGKKFWKIYKVSPEISKDSQGVLHPQFSHNGKNIIWSERVKANKRAPYTSSKSMG